MPSPNVRSETNTTLLSKDHASIKTGRQVLAASSLGLVLQDWQPLVGGVSASVFRMSYESSRGEHCDAVVRCHGDVDYARNPRIAADEFAVVGALYDAGLRVPKPLYLGNDAGPLGRPFAIYDYVGAEVISDRVGLGVRVPAMARWLADFHSVDLSSLGLRTSFANGLRPRQALAEPVQPLDREIFEPQIRALLTEVGPPGLSGKSVLLHGDFWSGNLLWRGVEIAAVIDWEDFGVGDAFADLACARIELLWSTDELCVDRFTQLYLAARDLKRPELAATLAYWDLCAVLPFANTLAAISENRLEREEKRARLGGFVERAAAALGVELLLGA